MLCAGERAGRAYAPFGETYAETGAADRSFTGQTQDVLAGPTGIYDFLFRQHASSQGRWLVPDPAGLAAVNLSNPQTWNRYAYVGNNPLSYIDPTGLCDEPDQWDPSTNTVTGSQPCQSWWTFVIQGLPQYAYCAFTGSCSPYPPGGGGGGSTSQPQPTPQPQPKPQPAPQKPTICRAIPSGRTIGISGGVGGVGSPGGGGELVVNYNSGQVSAFGFGGVQVGWNGGASGSIYTGFVYGLNNSNSNYSGGFTGVNGGAVLGGLAASSSGGLTGGPSGLIPNPRGVTVAGVSLGAALLESPTFGITATNYTNPAQLGKFWAFTPVDWAFYIAAQVCQ